MKNRNEERSLWPISRRADPAGAALVHILAHRGIDVKIVEHQRDFDREIRGERLRREMAPLLHREGLRARLGGESASFPPA